MSLRSWGPVLLFLAFVLSTPGCGGDDLPTGPDLDLDATPPEVRITAAPDAGLATHEVTLEWAATDDVGLASVTISWGIPASLEQVQVTGHSESGTFTYRYERIGAYQVFLTVRDEAGNVATDAHEISIEWPEPEPPARLVVTTEGNTAILGWEPGTWATSQEVVVARLDGAEPDRVLRIVGVATHEIAVPDLSWEESYQFRVAALNTLGRAESAPVAFDVPAPLPPFLDRFSAGIDDVSCLVVSWHLGPDALDLYEVVVTGDSEAESFAVQAPLGEWYSWTSNGGLSLEGRFCPDAYPVVDGMTYTAQVIGRSDDRPYGSNLRNWTVDLDPIYSATGTWIGDYTQTILVLDPRDRHVRRYTLELVETDGAVTGTWAYSDPGGEALSSGTVIGSRDSTSVEMTLERDGLWYSSIEGSFAGADGMVTTVWGGLMALDVFFHRQ